MSKLEEKLEKRGWKIDKNIPVFFILSVIFTLTIYAGMFLYSFATVTTELKNLTATVQDMRTEAYTINNADKDKEHFNYKLEVLDKRVTKLESK